MKFNEILILILFSLMLFIVNSTFAQSKVYPAKDTYFSIKEENAYIKEYGPGIAESNPIIKNKQVDKYLAILVDSLQKNSPSYAKKYKCKASLVLSQSLDAKAGMGCRLNIGIGTLSNAKTESEFAGIVAHELAHGILRHAVEIIAIESRFSQKIESLENELLLYAIGSNEFISLKTRIKHLQTERLISLENRSRLMETDADVLATQIISRAGFDPRDWQGFFEDRTSFDIYIKNNSRTHPTSKQRAARIAREISLLSKPEIHLDSDRFLEAKTVSTTICSVFFK